MEQGEDYDGIAAVGRTLARGTRDNCARRRGAERVVGGEGTGEGCTQFIVDASTMGG